MRQHLIKNYIIALLCLFAAIKSTAQTQNKPYFVQDLELAAGENKLVLKGPVTAIKINAVSGTSTPLDIQSAGQHYTLSFENTSHLEYPSNFTILMEPQTELSVHCVASGSYTLEGFFVSQSASIDLKTYLYKNEDCSKPDTVSQAVWRAGLKDPVPGRTVNSVKHCIIHHAASNNAHTDYIYVIRNIYLLHTASNGWDDIGYNFVIAPDGTVFSGRDALGVADEDNILGAHFCSKNTGTMGICLIGDYTKISPTDTMIQALVDLISWKLDKEQLSAWDAYPHPDANSSELGTIAMHRDGCATVCPGDSVALLLPSIKSRVHADLQTCTQNAGIETVKSDPYTLFPNPSTGDISITGPLESARVSVEDASGRVVLMQTYQGPESHLKINASGLYVVRIRTSLGRIFQKRILIL